MIIDSHVHVFPDLRTAAGFPSAEEHLGGAQRQSFFNVNPIVRIRDGRVIDEQALWDGRTLGPGGVREAGFRFGEFGRLEWDIEGEDVYVQLFAPGFTSFESSADYVVAELDYAGVDVAVLQTGPTYGMLNDYMVECIGKYPGRFVALGQVAEARAHEDDQLQEVSRCATELGHSGIFYSTLGFWETSYEDAADAPKYAPFWDLVEELGLVTYWDINTDVFDDQAAWYVRELERMNRVLTRHPGLRVVVVQALPLDLFKAAGSYRIPPVLAETLSSATVLLEMAYPISHGLEFEYPYPELATYVRQLRDEVGPDRLVWGSDMPNVLRFCTYRQSFEYLRHCDLGENDLSAILGDNLAELFGLSDVGASP